MTDVVGVVPAASSLAVQQQQSTPLPATVPVNTGPLAQTPQFSCSISIAKIAAALAAAQAMIKQPKKSADNPFFKSKYSPLDAIWEACRMALAQNGIAVVQAPSFALFTDAGGKHRGMVTLTTMLAHSSGEWIRNIHTAVAENPGPQGSQSALTYTRRAALASMAMVTPELEDDDAETAEGRGVTEVVKPSADEVEAHTKALTDAAKLGTEALKAAYLAIPVDWQPQFAKYTNTLKTKAAKVKADAK